jgi:hypothetical protein
MRKRGGHGDSDRRRRGRSVHRSGYLRLFAVVFVVNRARCVADRPFGCHFLAVQMTADMLLESERLKAFCKLLRVEAGVVLALDAVANEGFKWCLRTREEMAALSLDSAGERLRMSACSLPFL